MSELNLPIENATVTKNATTADTNAEFILPQVEKKQPPVLQSVAKAIVVETVKDFFRSIVGFFLRYIRHFMRCFVYFFSPSVKKKPFNQLNYKENAQHTFELLLILLASVIFMEKLEWIPKASEDIFNLYSNDIVQKVTEIYYFIIFALLYLLMVFISIFSGRFFRKLFRVPVSKDESDILFNYLNNAFFSIATVFAFSLRCAASTNTHDQDSLAQFLVMCIAPATILFTLIWSIRFAVLNGLSLKKGILFSVVGFLVYTVLFFCSSFFLTAVLLAL